MLPDDVDARLRLEARRRGVSIADVVRDALEGFLPGGRSSGRLSFFGVGDADVTDASDRVDELVREAIEQKHGAAAPARPTVRS